MRGVERIWWMGLGVWLVVLFFWQPEPPPLYTNVPSVAPYPDGYRIFYDLVEKQSQTVSRTLRSPAHLETEDVLVLLNASEGLDADNREEITEWIFERGGTLLVGYPLSDDNGKWLKSVFPKDQMWNSSTWLDSDPKLKTVSYVPVLAEKARDTEPFPFKVFGQMELGEGSSKPMAVADDGTIIATYDAYGAGQIIQIADARILNNESLGFKKSHLFAAALIDEIGRDTVWVFDESNEGVSIQPELAPLLGAGPFRAVFLHLLLFFLFWYWYKSRRHLRILRGPDTRRVREVTTLSADVGNFYFRAKKSSWALSRYLQYYKRKLNDANISPQDREDAVKLEKRAEKLLENSGRLETQLHMVRELAERQQMLDKTD